MLGIVGALILRVIGRTPENMGQMPDGRTIAAPYSAMTYATPGPTLRLAQDRAFLTLSLGMALALFAQIGLIAQLVSVLTPVLGRQGAGFAASLATAAVIVGRLLVGGLMPVDADRRCIAALCTAVQAVGCVALLLSSGTSLPLLLIGIGLLPCARKDGADPLAAMRPSVFRRRS